ncbi:putative HIT finger domain protein [Aspergillus ibericus CBS 121593]|uniref:HIT-type domain-containing protein n=1 Tax=Aspergillus ibericus CBS 121593 TaxID=1448316 RepID=A0A395GPY6_9EURO|nr:hypothetical protein BO80DRAFT_448408 [Aspergillus ibericus CBS 121593]RAK97416.1 hypothetical protein BO80DRAFT_448408 [Aspergillus ibericus CBS 121593]
MYHVELLPSTKTHATPGWTYVPDRGFDPAKAAITPAIGRKRGIRDPGRADLTSRQSNAIVRHLAELDRENHRETQVPIPVKQKDASGRGTRGKVTSNVRRILQSQKTFRNYLDDEEASLAQQATTQAQQTTSHRPSVNKITKPTTSSSRRSSTPLTATTTAATTASKPDTSRQRKHPSIAPTSSRASTVTTLAETTEAEPETQPQAPAPDKENPTEPTNTTDLIKSEHDNDPLLKSYIPSAPSERIMQALVAEPPLTYNASRAGPPIMRKSPRYFCCMCGYWGKIRCKNCHLRTCGLDCYKVHEDSRCGAFF